MEKKVFTTKNQSIKETIEVYKNKEVYEIIKKGLNEKVEDCISE